MAGVRVAGLSYFNPRTPRGVRLVDANGRIVTSIFQSTHPVRGATSVHVITQVFLVISIHAPREGCDANKTIPAWAFGNFNPRTP